MCQLPAESRQPRPCGQPKDCRRRGVVGDIPRAFVAKTTGPFRRGTRGRPNAAARAAFALTQFLLEQKVAISRSVPGIFHATLASSKFPDWKANSKCGSHLKGNRGRRCGILKVNGKDGAIR